MLQLQLLKCKNYVLQSYMTVGWPQQAIWRCHPGLKEIVMDIIDEMLNLLAEKIICRLNDNKIVIFYWGFFFYIVQKR